MGRLFCCQGRQIYLIPSFPCRGKGGDIYSHWSVPAEVWCCCKYYLNHPQYCLHIGIMSMSHKFLSHYKIIAIFPNNSTKYWVLYAWHCSKVWGKTVIRQSSSPQGAFILMQENKQIIAYQLAISAMKKNKV